MDTRPAWVGRLDRALKLNGGLIKTYDACAFVLSKLALLLTSVFSFISRLFKWAAYEREDGKVKLQADGRPMYSAKRLSIRLAAFFALAWLLHISLSAVYFYSTTFEELVYTTGKQEIQNGELYQFTGCTSLPCSTALENGKFYQIKESWYFPYLVYPEENVFANIPQQDAACLVKGYGLYFRRLKFIHRGLQWYQNVFSVACRPYTDEEKQRAITSGQVSSVTE
ncbi:MAG: hypothetical protein V7756_05265 [Halopseudomonas sp.]|uniref:hypothetical protein n=1 Tax=Halopseudomonas sp. TaxID=2901191 RepID=UPI0030030354